MDFGQGGHREPTLRFANNHDQSSHNLFISISLKIILLEAYSLSKEPRDVKVDKTLKANI